MSSNTRKGKGCAPVPRKGVSRVSRKRSRLTLSTATAISTFVASALAALTALAGVLHHLLVWLLHVI
jgi:hypothetical protein